MKCVGPHKVAEPRAAAGRSREPPGVAAARRSRLGVSLQDLIYVPEPDVGIAPGDGQAAARPARTPPL